MKKVPIIVDLPQSLVDIMERDGEGLGVRSLIFTSVMHAFQDDLPDHVMDDCSQIIRHEYPDLDERIERS